jgi:hypothetical protein
MAREAIAVPSASVVRSSPGVFQLLPVAAAFHVAPPSKR